MKDGLLVVQVRKGFYSIKHHSGASVYDRCFTNKNDALTAFDGILPLSDWTKPLESFDSLPDEKRMEILQKVSKAVKNLKTVRWPEETDSR